MICECCQEEEDYGLALDECKCGNEKISMNEMCEDCSDEEHRCESCGRMLYDLEENEEEF
jgi:hypothetical protein